MDQIFDIKGKAAVITGATGVLGNVMARKWQEGSKLAVISTTKERAEKLAEEINSQGGTAIGIAANVLDKESLIQARERVVEAFEKVDILINGAGGNNKMPLYPRNWIFNIPADALEWVFNLNILGTVLTTQVFAELMVKQGRKYYKHLFHGFLSAFNQCNCLFRCQGWYQQLYPVDGSTS